MDFAAVKARLDDLPATPPPGFPGAPSDEAARFACEPASEPQPAQPIADERKPIVTDRE